jgi:hypothetical protein
MNARCQEWHGHPQIDSQTDDVEVWMDQGWTEEIIEVG